MITAEQFAHLFPRAQDPAGWANSMNNVFPTYDINTPQRVAAFLAQCGHESGGWTVFEENLNYSAQGLNSIFKKYFPTIESATPYARQPEKIANRVYANRMGNGPEESGDGWKFACKGLIQLTGRTNYTWFAASLEISVEEASEYLQTFEGAAQSACWFWENNNLNRFADVGDIKGMTKVINGGYIGLEDREKHYQHALHVMGA